MKPTDKIPGEVWLDDLLAYSDLSPHATEQGLTLYRIKTSSDEARTLETRGPHLHIYPVVPFLISNLEAAGLEQGAAFSFTGPCLGHISMLHGYAAADAGSQTRAIKSLNLTVAVRSRLLRSSTLHFELNGIAGSLLPWSCPGGAPTTEPQQRTFRIWFTVPEQEIPCVIAFGGCANAIRQKLRGA